MVESNTYNLELAKKDTEIIKGIAIIAMLMHHLWGCSPNDVEPYTGVLAFLGILGKVCVTMFLFCSGYGLTIGYQRIVEESGLKFGKCRLVETLKFIAKRFVKFYMNYWLIFMIFVPISVFFGGRTLSSAYGEDADIIKMLLCDFIGVQGYNSYNVTWWFNRLILELYLLFPILFYVVKRSRYAVLVLSLVLMRFAHLTWQFPFIVGIFWAQNIYRLPKMNVYMNNHRSVFILYVVVFLLLSIIIRTYPIFPQWSNKKMDTFITIGMVLLLCVINIQHYLSLILTFLGKHSMNIYMTHTFFFSYWFSSFFYSRELGGG